MKLKYEISQAALEDLEGIWRYTAVNWSVNQANKYYNEIFQILDDICTYSELGQSIDEVKLGHRSIKVKSHIIIYKIMQEVVYVDRILHQRMDIGNL